MQDGPKVAFPMGGGPNFAIFKAPDFIFNFVFISNKLSSCFKGVPDPRAQEPKSFGKHLPGVQNPKCHHEGHILRK